MKKLVSIVMLVSFIFNLSSCSDDDRGNSNYIDDTIVGAWTISFVEFSFVTEESSDIGTIPASFCSEDYIFTFSSNGDLTVSDITLDFEEALEGNLEFACEVNGGLLNGTWKPISEDFYTLTVEGDALPSTVYFSNQNNTIEIIITNDQTDDPVDPFRQTLIFKGVRN